VHATAFVAEKRPFDVNAEDAGHTLRDGGTRRENRLFDDVQIVADQRGEKSRRAEAPVSDSDGGDGFDARIVVEQHAAAAVHLAVDESRREQIPFEIDRLIGADDLARADDRLDAPVAHQQVAAALDAGIGENSSVS
jgi:hypothetical protein